MVLMETQTWTHTDNEPEPLPLSDSDIRESSDAAFLSHEAREFVGAHDLEDIDAALTDPKRAALVLWLAQAFVAGGHEDESAFCEARELSRGFAAVLRDCVSLRNRREDSDDEGFVETDVDTLRAPGIGFTSSDFSGKAA